MEDFYYRKLNVYQESLQLVADIYALSILFPTSEQYGLSDQIKRAVVSVPSNIAEGMGRFSLKERIHFLEIACGSLMEVMCQLEIANMVGYIAQEVFVKEEQSVTRISKMLVALRKAMEEKLGN